MNLLTLVATKATNGTGKELADAAGLAVPTAHHLLATLVSDGFLAQDERARYLLGPKIAVLSDAMQRDLTPPSYLLAALHDIVSKTGETTYLATWRRGEIHLLSVVEGSYPVRVSVPLGNYGEAHARASGKLFLAYLHEDERDNYLDVHPLRKIRPNTITSRKRLLAELELIRERGCALDEEEFQDGVCCISVPVFQDGVIIAAYSLSIPTQRYREGKDELIATALEAVARLGEPLASAGAQPDGSGREE
jgi:IclR family acetate operon transcriptional repressor